MLAAAVHVVTRQAMLIPPVVDGLYLAGEDKQERGQRPELVDHNAGVEVAESASSAIKDVLAELRVGPEGFHKVL